MPTQFTQSLVRMYFHIMISVRYLFIYLFITLRAKKTQCIVIGPVCGFVCLFVCVCLCVRLWVCYLDNSKLRASILTKLGL